MNNLFNFNLLVDEVYNKLENKSNNINVLILPNLICECFTTKIVWKNINEYLNTINRNDEHFLKFLRFECHGKNISWNSNNKDDGLVFHNMKKQKEIKELSIKYINNYVICSSCNKYNTNLNKNKDVKKYEFICLDCGYYKIDS
jgi:translation initiation factor 2 beta subunit (eIF-2beta)/eIF-5